MRLAAIASALAILLCAAVFGAIFLQRTSVSGPAPSPALASPGEAQAPAAATNARAEAVRAAGPAEQPIVVAQAAPAPPAASTCSNPNALGISRVVEIDTTGGPGFGFEHFKSHDFLREGEVVLTFDDGPWPKNTANVLAALAAHCTKAIFFPIGLHATYEPGILKQVAAAGHAVGAHTWSHVNLNNKKMTEQQVKDELEKGFSAVRMALGAQPAPFFRFPQLQHNPAAMAYLGSRNVAMFSTDLDSFDFRANNPEQIITTVMAKVDKLGKGIILMHDFQKNTAEALPALLRRLKAGGYKVVQMKAKAPLETLPEYDAMLVKEAKLPTISSRPVGAVVQTVTD